MGLILPIPPMEEEAASSNSDYDVAPSLSDLHRHGSTDWHIPQRPGVLVQVPGGGKLHPRAQGHLRHIAQVAARFVDREVIVRAVELDTMSRDERRNVVAAEVCSPRTYKLRRLRAIEHIQLRQ